MLDSIWLFGFAMIGMLSVLAILVMFIIKLCGGKIGDDFSSNPDQSTNNSLDMVYGNNTNERKNQEILKDIRDDVRYKRY